LHLQQTTLLSTARQEGVMRIDIVSDIVCPWCYVGKRRLEQALAQRPALAFDLRWHPFELNPQVPDGGVDRESFWREKFGDAASLGEMVGQLVETGMALAIDFDFAGIRVQPNTRRAHELMQLAGAHGCADALAEALFDAYFVRGIDIGAVDELRRLGETCGLPQAALEETLVRRRNELVVDEHLRQMRAAGVTAVPTFIINGQHAFSGAQSPEFILQVIDHLAAGEVSAGQP
jgi:predicted DsbA family dithiol-disulfide isomerase